MNQRIIGLPTYREVNGPSGIVWRIEDIGFEIGCSRRINRSQIILGAEKINCCVSIKARRQDVLGTVPVGGLRDSFAYANLVQDASGRNVVIGSIAKSIRAPITSIR